MQPEYDDKDMQEFITAVQLRGGLDTLTEADQVARAALSTLAETVSVGQMEQLTTALPMAPSKPGSMPEPCYLHSRNRSAAANSATSGPNYPPATTC